LNAKGEIYGAGDNQQGQLGLQKGSVTEKFQKTRDGIRTIYVDDDITYAITSGNNLIKFTTGQDQVIAENVLKFTQGGFVTLDNQFKKLDDGKTLISEDVVDAVFSSFWLKTDGSVYYKTSTDEHLVVKDDAIESL
jgi:alpha-tubulin suppressor-like RCC1 family protein